MAYGTGVKDSHGIGNPISNVMIPLGTATMRRAKPAFFLHFFIAMVAFIATLLKSSQSMIHWKEESNCAFHE